MKHIFKITISFIVILVILIFVGSIDNNSYDDLGLLESKFDIPDDQNGFKVVSYTQIKDFNLDLDEETKEELKDHLYHKKWDNEFINNLIIDNEKHIKNVELSTKLKYFKFQEVESIESIPSYQPIMSIHRLTILKSMYEARAGNLNNAIFLAETAILFSQKVKTESNNLLISHMIGLVMQYESLLWVHHLVTDYELNENQYTNLLNIFNSIPSYKEDSFAEIFSGEFAFSEQLLNEIIERPLNQRWDEYWDSQDWWNSNVENDYDMGKEELKEKVFNFFQMLIPRYYVHKNEILNIK